MGKAIKINESIVMTIKHELNQQDANHFAVNFMNDTRKIVQTNRNSEFEPEIVSNRQRGCCF